MKHFKIIGRKTGWNLVIRHKIKDQFPYIAYAVHRHGKVEREGRYLKLDDAISAGGDLVRMLNLYSLHAGKNEGKDKLEGRKLDSKKIDDRAKFLTKAIHKLIAANKRIFGM